MFGLLLGGLLGSALGAGVQGAVNTGFNAISQNQALANSRELGAYNAMLQHQTQLRSGSAMRQAYQDMGRSSTFEGAPIQMPSTSSPAITPQSHNLDLNFLSDLRLKDVMAKKTMEETNTEKKKQDEIDANIEKLNADTQKIGNESEKIVLDSYSQRIINHYLDEMQTAYIRHLNADSSRIDKELEINFKKLPYELKYLAAAAYQANTQGKVNNKTIEFIGSQIKKIDKELDGFQHIWDNLDADTKKKLKDADISENVLRSVGSQADIDEIETRIIKANLTKYEKALIADWFKRFRSAYNPVSFMLGRE